jgi:hypothetical protein
MCEEEEEGEMSTFGKVRFARRGHGEFLLLFLYEE